MRADIIPPGMVRQLNRPPIDRRAIRRLILGGLLSVGALCVSLYLYAAGLLSQVAALVAVLVPVAIILAFVFVKHPPDKKGVPGSDKHWV
jgi:uncharacterized membrane protein